VRQKILAKKNTVNQDDRENKEKDVVAEKEPKEGFNITEFAVETKEELGKVVWPSRQQVISESAAVMLMVILVSTLIYSINSFFAWGASKVFL
jgi:preprotein translocase subunit SecE